MGDPVTTSLIVGSTLLKAVGSINEGKATAQAANYEAQQADINAKQERAASQRRAADERRRARLTVSRAQAVAASSGGGALDPTVVNIIGDLEGEGEFNALTALYEGEERGRDLEAGASLRRYEGKQAKRAGYMGALGAIAEGGASLYSKYGKDDDPAQTTDGRPVGKVMPVSSRRS